MSKIHDNYVSLLLVPTPPALPDYCTAQPTPTCVTTIPSPSQGESILVPMYDSTYHCSE